MALSTPLPSCDTRIGVIDIGSNSVRLVVYDGIKRVPIPIFNEKVFCSLARNLTHSGKLHPEGTELATRALARFIHIARGMGVEDRLTIFATAAVRDASDGAAFVEGIETAHQVTVTIFSGQQEAEYAGLGVLACIQDAEGMVGDLGGGSLECARIHQGKVSAFHSYPIGLLRLLNAQDTSLEALTTLIDNALLTLPFLSDIKGKTFYAVGGGFRTLAKMHIALSHYPLRMVHHYTVSAKSLHPLIKRVADMAPETIAELTDISAKRIETLPHTALLLDRILTVAKPADIVFSAYGIREGFLFSQLSKAEQQQDPLLAGCIDMMARVEESSKYGHEVYEWMKPLFEKEDAAASRLRLAACLLHGISRYEHTEYRAEIAFRRFLDSSITGIGHYDRLFIARTLFHRYQTSSDLSITGVTDLLLDAAHIRTARVIGLALRLAYNIAAGTTGILPFTSLSLGKNSLTLQFSEKTRVLMGEAVSKRFDKLAEALEVSGNILEQ